MGGARPAWLMSLTQHGTTPPVFLKFRSSEGFIISTVSLAVFTDMFLYSSIVPVIPFALQSRINIDPDHAQRWVSILLAVYGAALLVFCPICGWLADQSSSRRSPLVLGLLALLGATVMLNVGSSIGVLVVARLLQGASAAVVWVVGLALMAETVPECRVAQAMGWAALGMSLGILVGPILGGVVFERAGYNAVFAMSYAIIGLDILLRLALVEKKVAARWGPEAHDTASHDRTTSLRPSVHEGAAHPASSISSSQSPPPSPPPQSHHPEKGLSPLSKHSSHHSLPPPFPLPTNFIPPPAPARTPLRSRLPPLLSLLYSRRLLAALFASLIISTLMTSFDAVLPLHALSVFNFHSTASALFFLPLVLPSFLGPLVGWGCDRFGPRLFATLGFLLACPGYVCLRFVDANTIGDKVLFCALLTIIGASSTLVFPPLMAEITLVVEAKERGMLARGEKGFGAGGAYAQAYGLFNMAFAGGCLVGPMWAGFVRERAGWGTMGWSLGLLSAVTAVPAFCWMGGWFWGSREDEQSDGREGTGGEVA